MKILWFSNISLTNWAANKSGTWIYCMYEHLESHQDVNVICNITLGKKDKKLTQVSKNGLTEYFIPASWLNKNGTAKSEAVLAVDEIIKSWEPDIIHIWGLELCWAGICQQLPTPPQLIDIQGLKGICSNDIYFTGGISNFHKKTRGFLEVIYPRLSAKRLQSEFRDWGKFENRILSKAQYISAQSEMVDTILRLTPGVNGTIFRTDIILRDDFLTCETWNEVHSFNNSAPIVFCLSASRIYKGVHVAIEAFSILRLKYPNAKLRIAGIGLASRSILNSGYTKYLLQLIKNLGIEENVDFLGNIDASHIINELYQCDVCVNPTFIETYCLSLAEALAVGTPCVASYTSALPELISNGINGALFPMGDSYSCAREMLKFIDDKEYSLKISREASTRQRKRNSSNRIGDNQIEIYRNILAQRH